MAKSTKKSSTAKTSSSTETNVTRIKASDDNKRTKSTKTHKLTAKEQADITESKELKPSKFKMSSKQKVEQQSEKTSKKRRRPFRAAKEYFRGSWYELRQVRWPDRRSTWGMTIALILFTVFIGVIILLLDALFKYLFTLMIG